MSVLLVMIASSSYYYGATCFISLALFVVEYTTVYQCPLWTYYANSRHGHYRYYYIIVTRHYAVIGYHFMPPRDDGGDIAILPAKTLFGKNG